MIEIKFKDRKKISELDIGDTFQLADTYYQKTDNIYPNYTDCVNLEEGKIKKLHNMQIVIPKHFVLTADEK